VVVIAQSSNASGRLGDLVDTLLIYEEDVNPVRKNNSASTSRKRSNTPRKLEDI
jgi:hypothetical protein